MKNKTIKTLKNIFFQNKINDIYELDEEIKRYEIYTIYLFGITFIFILIHYLIYKYTIGYHFISALVDFVINGKMTTLPYFSIIIITFGIFLSILTLISVGFKTLFFSIKEKLKMIMTLLLGLLSTVLFISTGHIQSQVPNIPAWGETIFAFITIPTFFLFLLYVLKYGIGLKIIVDIIKKSDKLKEIDNKEEFIIEKEKITNYKYKLDIINKLIKKEFLNFYKKIKENQKKELSKFYKMEIEQDNIEKIEDHLEMIQIILNNKNLITYESDYILLIYMIYILDERNNVNAYINKGLENIDLDKLNFKNNIYNIILKIKEVNKNNNDKIFELISDIINIKEKEGNIYLKILSKKEKELIEDLYPKEYIKELRAIKKILEFRIKFLKNKKLYKLKEERINLKQSLNLLDDGKDLNFIKPLDKNLKQLTTSSSNITFLTNQLENELKKMKINF